MTKNILGIYSTSDKDWQERVNTHLGLITNNFPVEIDYWNESFFSQFLDENAIESLLSRASVIVLLLSQSFFNSGIMKSEVIRTRLKMKQEGGFPIFTLILDKCKWKTYPWLKALPTFPVNDGLLVDLKEAEQERTLADLAFGVFQALNIKKQVEAGFLGYIELNGVGHIDNLAFEPASRLSILTGDNGYGKSLLLECMWWTLSGKWPQFSLFPNPDKQEATIAFRLRQRNGESSDLQRIRFDFNKRKWPDNNEFPKYSGLVLYARADGSFTVWDPIKGRQSPPFGAKEKESPLVFSKWQVFDGISEEDGGKKRSICNGMVVDWNNWQNTSSAAFDLLKKIIYILSEHSGEVLEPAELVTVDNDNRPMPSLKYKYGNVPIIYAASSVQRIISLAYLLVWMWEEHKNACAKTKNLPYQNIILLLDEAECHLHPKWQRAIIPALLEIEKFFSDYFKIQFIISTHSPLLLASLEPGFKETEDKLFHFDMKEANITIESLPFLKHGRVDYWFTSDAFDLTYARSIEAEQAIKEALELQKTAHPDKEKVKQINIELCRVLGEMDTFWPRWNYFAKQHGAFDDLYPDET